MQAATLPIDDKPLKTDQATVHIFAKDASLKRMLPSDLDDLLLNPKLIRASQLDMLTQACVLCGLSYLGRRP